MFTVPAGVTSVTVNAIGASGGNNPCALEQGGEGASITATLSVEPGEVLFVGVGGHGGDVPDISEVCGGGGVGGVGGGGAGGSGGGAEDGGGGGGASLVGISSPSAGFQGLLLVAGGGGGATSGQPGGNAGSDGLPSSGCGFPTEEGCGGESGTTGGQGGASDAEPGNANGGQGLLGLGGEGGNSAFEAGGGGGGAGYLGGGGGGAGAPVRSGSGGGGSSFAASEATNVSGPIVTASAAEVAITYGAPTAEESAPEIEFGTQPLGTVGTEQVLTVTNEGSAPLIVSGVLLGGEDPGDYVSDDRCGQPVGIGASCEVGVRFSPQAEGERAATLTLLTNAATAPGVVSLTGTGGPLPKGSTGPEGPRGAAGATGAAGAAGAAGIAGATGAAGATGTAGQRGAAGPKGPTGPAGRAGKVELVTCETHTLKVGSHGHSGFTHKRTCTVVGASGTVTLGGEGAAARAQLLRGGRLYASGTGVFTGHGGTKLLLSERLPLSAGSYTLVLRRHLNQRWTTTRETVTLA